MSKEEIINIIYKLKDEDIKDNSYSQEYYLKPLIDKLDKIRPATFKNACLNTNLTKISKVRLAYYLAKYLNYKKRVTKEWSRCLADIIIISKDYLYMVLYAENIEYAPIDRLLLAILESHDIEFISLFARVVFNVDYHIITRYLTDNTTIDMTIEFIRRFPNSPKEDIIEKVINSNSSEKIYDLCKQIPLKDIKPLEDKLIMLNNPEYLYLFCINIPNSNKKRLGYAILNSYSSKYIYLYNKEYHLIPSEEVKNYINYSDDIYYIYLFYKNEYNISLVHFLNNTTRVGELLINFSYEDRLKYLIYLLMNKKIVDYWYRIHYYKDFLMDPVVSLDKAYNCDIKYDNYIHKKDMDKSLERILK